MAQIRAMEASQPATMVENMSKACMEMLTSFVTLQYHEAGGRDEPRNFTSFMLRLMQRPFLQFDPELFSEVITNQCVLSHSFCL